MRHRLLVRSGTILCVLGVLAACQPMQVMYYTGDHVGIRWEPGLRDQFDEVRIRADELCGETARHLGTEGRGLRYSFFECNGP